MSKIKLYIAMSLDGKIAKNNDDVSWLDEVPNPDNTDYGYYDFYEKVDTVVMGNGTYRFVQNMDIEYPYKAKTSYVITRNNELKDNEDVKFIDSGQAVDLLSQLKKEDSGDIWLVGGGQVNTLFANSSLIDEISIHVMPIIIGEGIPLFREGLHQKMLSLISSKSYESGVVELVYKFR